MLQCADCNFSFSLESNLGGAKSGGAALGSLLSRYGTIGAVQTQALKDSQVPLGTWHVVDWSPEGDISIRTDDTQTGSDFSALATPPQHRRVVLSVGQLEAFPNPLQSLRNLLFELGPQDTVTFIFSDVRHVGARVGSRQWERLIGERNTYLDTQSALKVLFRAGFRCQSVTRLRRKLSLEDWMEAISAGEIPETKWRKLISLLPQAVGRRIHTQAASAEVAIVATPRPTEKPKVSVIVPIFNEAATVASVIDSVLRVQFEDASIEAILVESNSTDGSREIVQRYSGHSQITTVFEERPGGKGQATRLGLSYATGDVVLIQDADLEYDFEDYHTLVEPILRGCEAFTLGSRHGGRNHWKLRSFGTPLLSKLYNVAHVLVTFYINLLFGLRLRDPQTMFKVCRRDCIEGLDFRANYFDFDYELLLKVVRKGFQPLEIPVNYRSRSHDEGKKLRMWRDAPLGLWMITRMRFLPLRRFLRFGERLP